ncbi:MAG TPA: LCP family protein [Candidatus Saccharimonadia bacterium]|nr:LCP family protein [Candidatus Saccharimonadia bacterium]
MSNVSPYLTPAAPPPIEPIQPVQDGRARPDRTRRRPRRKRIVLTITSAILAVILVSVGYVGWKFVQTATKISGGSIFGLLSDTKLDGEAQGRVNILLAGDSADDPGHGGADLTDSIMVVSIDTKTNQAYMLSIPRDLWVNIPGHGYAKINSAYEDGGMPLLEQVVDQDFGIHLNYYALVDYTAFKSAVNAVGGITVDIKSSDPRGIYDPNISKSDDGPLLLKNGVQQLDGQTALNLARARNDPTPSGLVGYGLPNGDFDRAANQRMMLQALETKTLSTGVWANPIKIGQLLDSLGNNVTTDFKTDQLLRLYQLVKKVNVSSIKSLSLTVGKQIQNYTTSDGQSALIPESGLGNYTGLQLFVRQQSSTNPVVEEGATAVILNGSGVNGLAKKDQAALIADGIDVTQIATASDLYPETTLEDNSQAASPASLKLINAQFSPVLSSSTSLAGYYGVNYVIILGENLSPNNP